MAGSVHQDEILNWLIDTLMVTTPRFQPTGDPGERQRQIDQFIGHSAKCDLVRSMNERFNIRDMNPNKARSPLDTQRARFFEGHSEPEDET